MQINHVSPNDAHTALAEDKGAVYLDVRTEGEFLRGHPEGAINVPVAFANPGGGLQPNPQFVELIEKVIPKDTPLYCGCQSGRRSVAACDLLSRAGFTQISNVEGGFGGQVDRAGVMVKRGWRDAGLPVSTSVTDENSHAGFKQRAGL